MAGRAGRTWLREIRGSGRLEYAWGERGNWRCLLGPWTPLGLRPAWSSRGSRCLVQPGKPLPGAGFSERPETRLAASTVATNGKSASCSPPRLRGSGPVRKRRAAWRARGAGRGERPRCGGAGFGGVQGG